MQIELGCDPNKLEHIGNGLKTRRFSEIPAKKEDGWIDIGAIVRFAPIKDIKTMIYTFSRLKQEVSNVRLHIMGGVEDQEYYQECIELIEYLNVPDIVIPGNVDVIKYIEKIDFTILTSISEGQPFAVLESFAANRPVIATDVGSCRELIEGREDDDFGPAGICIPPMHQSELLQALLELCSDTQLRETMGESGRKRVTTYYEHETMVTNYLDVYQKAIKIWQESDLN
jgi:glycosyltransferase involved in cell wall biosynthesis